MNKEENESSFSCTPPEIAEVAEAATLDLLPQKSRILYEKEYTIFITWCETNNFSENVLLAYFVNKSKTYKASSLWSYYSMLKSTLSIKNNVDISKFGKLIAFLKRQSDNYKPKKSNIFTRDQIVTFIREAPDNTFLMIKVALIMAVAGACRREELTSLTVDDIEDLNSALIVKLRETKTKISRTFTVVNNTEDFLGIYRKYVLLRPQGVKHKLFFVSYKNGKCSTQSVGKNTFGLMPAKIAEYLKIPNPGSYTGHCFRRSSATLLADSGGNITNLKRHGGWKSCTVAEGYVEDSIQNKINTATKILRNEANTVLTSTSKINQCELNIDYQQNQTPVPTTSSFPSVHVYNCNNCKVDVHINYE